MVAFLIAGFFVRASEWSEFTYGAKRLQPKELLWRVDLLSANKNFSFLVDGEHHYSTWPGLSYSNP